MRKFTAALCATAMVALLFAVSPAAASCLGSGGRSDLATGVTPGDVDNGEVDKYKLTVPSGQLGYVAIQMFNGDIDIKVCTNNGNELVCEGTNFMGINDGCHVSELNDPSGLGLYEWGNALPPGTYRLDVQHCFSSVEGPGCDYLDQYPGMEPGTHDDAPAVQYVIAFATN